MATWSSASFEINPGAYYEMSILSGKANIFMANNANSEDIYIGMGAIPRADHYEKILKRNTTDVFGRPTPVSRVYFYNPSDQKVGLTVWFTYDDNFDYTLLKSMVVDLQGAAMDGLKYDGIIRGVTSGVNLPTRDAEGNQYLSRIATVLEAGATTNQTILEGINAILASL